MNAERREMGKAQMREPEQHVRERGRKDISPGAVGRERRELLPA